jgi:ABC-2 type transport system ATP-binding protein
LGEICDSAAIIEAGRILASGTIEEIGKIQREIRGKSTSTVLALRVIQGIDAVERWLVQQPFVSAVKVAGQVAGFEFEGDEAARHQLLRNLLANGFEIVEFHGKTESLEDAFMAITEGITQ